MATMRDGYVDKERINGVSYAIELLRPAGQTIVQ